MTPLIHCSIGNTSLIPRISLANTRRETQTPLKKCNFTKRSLLPPPAFHLIQIYNPYWISQRNLSRTRILTSAVEADVAVEADASPPEEAASEQNEPEPEAEVAEEAVASPEAKVKRPRPSRKSDLPPVKDEDLVPGSTFTGVVRTIQPFGIFIDFGAFTDGLVHISQISSGFVKDVKALFTTGQEVQVRVLEADMQTGRISLSMKPEGEEGKESSSKEGGRGNQRGKPRRERRRHRYVEGEILMGTVEDIANNEAVLSLPEGGVGILPLPEEPEAAVEESPEAATAGSAPAATLSSAVEIGQEIEVRVASITRGQVILAINEGGVSVKKKRFKTEDDEFLVGGNFDVLEELDVGDGEEDDEGETGEAQGEGETGEVGEMSVAEDPTMEIEDVSVLVNPFVLAFGRRKWAPVNETVSDSVSVSETAVAEASSVTVTEEVAENASVSISDSVSDSVSETAVVSDSGFVADSISESSVGVTDEVKESEAVSAEIEEKGVVSDSVTVEGSVSKSETGVVESEASEVTATGESEDASDGKMEDVVSAEMESAKAVADESSSENAANGNSNEGHTVKATISPALVKQLREETGAGMMDCKKALAETNGDLAMAQEYLRKKGLASADKKSGRATAEGRIGSYVHDGRIGVLIEVNCETDFVSRGEIFQELVEDLSMQVAACPQVTCLTSEDVPEEVIKKEKEIEMQREDILSKPENIREKIVEGRVRKRLDEFALLEQPFIKNDKITVKDMVKQTIATIGENIKVKRFVRYNLGDGLEKKSQDFAAEVAAQTAAKSSPPPPPVTEKTETAENVEKASETKVTISPALVKQLRDETGAGMMDCKKALAETNGDMEKAQEYLRKKGLSSADKKSSRLAAEGLIASYIHDSRMGCLIEVNSETDFVARNDKFRELADDLAMQVIACPQVEYVSVDEIPASAVAKEKEIEMQREDLQSKPENIREKIVEGRIAKRLGELALLEQPYIKDDSITVKELVKKTIASLGENIRVRRFVRYTLGENKD